MREQQGTAIARIEATRCDPPPYSDLPLTGPRQASGVVWASISNSAAWPRPHAFEDALAIGLNVIEQLYAAGFVVAKKNGSEGAQ